MRFSQVHDVQIVADACAVRGGVVSAEDRQRFPHPCNRLCQEWHQVVGDAKGPFTNARAWMCANGVEIPKQGDAVVGMRGGMVGQHPFAGLLGPSVGRFGLLERCRFVHWHRLGLAIDGAARREHHISNVEGVRDLEQRAEPANIVGGVAGRLRNAFTDGLEGGEVQDAHDGMPKFLVVLEDVPQPRGVLDVDLVEREFRVAAEFTHAIDGHSVRVAQVVEQHRRESGFVQRHGRMTSNVTGTAGDQNAWTRTHVANLHSTRRMKPFGQTSRTSLHASSL